jgi:hypothetical protein
MLVLQAVEIAYRFRFNLQSRKTGKEFIYLLTSPIVDYPFSPVSVTPLTK